MLRFPGAFSLLVAMPAVEEGLKDILEKGTREQLLPKEQHRKRLYEILRYQDYNLFDNDIFNIKI